MKLATFEANGKRRIGIVSGEWLIEIPGDMISLIGDWDKRKGEITKIAREGKPQFKLSDVHLLAPVPAPQKILAIGLNYADHV